MKIYAHRGYSRKYPENTMIAFEKALAYDCDGIECDIQLTRDKVPVIIHDEKIDRTSDGKGYVKNFTYRELLAFDFAHHKPGNYGKSSIITLRELLLLIRDSRKDISLNLELKNDSIEYRGLEQIVLSEVEEFEDNMDIIYSSFNHNSLRLLQKLKKGIQTAALIDRELPDLPRYLNSLGTGGIHPSILILNEEIIENLLARNFYVNVYTINDAALAKRLSDHNVTGIFTDYCKEMKEALLFGKEFSID